MNLGDSINAIIDRMLQYPGRFADTWEAFDRQLMLLFDLLDICRGHSELHNGETVTESPWSYAPRVRGYLDAEYGSGEGPLWMHLLGVLGLLPPPTAPLDHPTLKQILRAYHKLVDHLRFDGWTIEAETPEAQDEAVLLDLLQSRLGVPRDALAVTGQVVLIDKDALMPK